MRQPFETMSQLPAKTDDNPIASAIHLEFIRTVADSSNGAGIEDVEAFHRALFLNRHGKDLERFQQERRIRQDRLVGLEARLKHTRDRLAGEEHLVPVYEDGRPDTQPTAPWNIWDGTMFVSAALAILCLLIFGIFNISFNLLESGIVTFAENPVRAYLWAALLPVGALAVKVGWDVLQSRQKRDIYLWTCLVAGLAGVLTWVAAYASVYPTLSQSPAEHIESLSVFDSGNAGDYLSRLTSGGVKRIDMILVAAQAIAEICLSAVLGMYMTQIYARHRPVRLAANPAYVQFDRERRSLEESVAQERLALAQAKGEETRLEHQLSAFVTYARSLFQKEIALRRDRSHQKRLLIDQMAEQLKSRLEAVDRDGEPSSNGDQPPRLAVDRESVR